MPYPAGDRWRKHRSAFPQANTRWVRRIAVRSRRQVVEGDAVDRLSREGLGHPVGDQLGVTGSGAGAHRAASSACTATDADTADEITDPAIGDQLLELRQGRHRIGAVETAAAITGRPEANC